MQLLFLDDQVWKKIIEAFCWMLVHSIWQGLFIAMFCGLTIYLTRKGNAALRYNVLTVLFFSFLVTCLVTFLYECSTISQTTGTNSPFLADRIASLQFINFYELQRLTMSFSNFCSAHALEIVMTWFVFFLFKLSSLMRSLSHVRLIKKSKIIQPGAFWELRIQLLCTKLHIIKHVSLMESAVVKIPVVIGFLKPVILIPIGLLNHLPAVQVEAVLLHELAHIRRHDYLINFIQNIAGTVFFFNPALLWLSSLMKIERENCCDDVALDHTKNKKQFLEALISFKEYASAANNYALAFPGTKNQLLHRFSRIINNQNKNLAVSEKIFLLVSLFCCLALFIVIPGRIHPAEKSSHFSTHQPPTANTITKVLPAQSPPITRSSITRVTNKKNPGSKKIRHFVKESSLVNPTLERAVNIQEETALNSLDDQKNYKYESIETIKMAEENKYKYFFKLQQATAGKEQSDLDRQEAEKDKIVAEKKMRQAMLDKAKSVEDQQRAFADAQSALQMKLKAEKDMQAVKLNRTISQHME